MIKYLVAVCILGGMQLVNAQVNPCEGMASGFVAHPADCTRYYSCVNNVAYERQCPSVYPIFRADTQMCDSGNPAECVTCPPAGIQRFPITGSCTRFVLCLNGAQHFSECQNGLVFDATISQCNLPENAPVCLDAQCPAVDDPANPVFIRHPTNCAIYFICLAGSPIEQTCPTGTAFNTVTNVCDRETSVTCPASWLPKASSFILAPEKTAKANDRCAGRSGISYLPDPDNCSRYYMCLNGKEFNAACSSGLIFDTISSKCSKPEASTCVRDNPCSNAVGVEYKPHQTDCNAYYMCMGQSLFKLTCSPGNSFDVTTRKCQSQARATCYGQTPQNNLVCVGISGVGSVPDPNDCSRYYLCINGQGHAQQCVPGLIFDVVTSQCNRPEVSVCANEVVSPPTAAPAIQIPEVTPPPYVPAPIPAPMPAPIPAPVPVPSYPGTPYCTSGQEYYRSHPDCRKFYWCVYGTLYEKNCPPNQHWNPEREYCDYVWNARCSAY